MTVIVESELLLWKQNIILSLYVYHSFLTRPEFDVLFLTTVFHISMNVQITTTEKHEEPERENFLKCAAFFSF